MNSIQLCLRCSHTDLNHRGVQDGDYPCIIGGCSCKNFRFSNVKVKEGKALTPISKTK